MRKRDEEASGCIGKTAEVAFNDLIGALGDRGSLSVLRRTYASEIPSPSSGPILSVYLVFQH